MIYRDPNDNEFRKDPIWLIVAVLFSFGLWGVFAWFVWRVANALVAIW